jgi:tRNA (guanine37-N1)-methyltransferase
VRLLPGVMGEAASHQDESFEDGLLEYPHYTRPQSFEGHEIPAVLNGGHHKLISQWRRAEAETITRNRRPDLWAAFAARTDANTERPTKGRRT